MDDEAGNEPMNEPSKDHIRLTIEGLIRSGPHSSAVEITQAAGDIISYGRVAYTCRWLVSKDYAILNRRRLRAEGNRINFWSLTDKGVEYASEVMTWQGKK